MPDAPKPARLDVDAYLETLSKRHGDEPEYLQAVRGVLEDLSAEIVSQDAWIRARILDRLIEPDRIVAFRIDWTDEQGTLQVNRGWRVQHNSALGPYKGGLRFHPDLTPSVLKFLALEQTFKNALTDLPLGAGKGGADFDPRGRSDGDILRFCNALMLRLHALIGDDLDVPAGDINVGPREIGYLFGAYRRITGRYEAALTGKGEDYGGSAGRVEATGFGLIAFLCCMMRAADETLEGARIAVSGAGNVATHAALRAIERGATVVCLSDSRGLLVKEDGLTADDVAKAQAVKAAGEALGACADAIGADWREGETPWGLAVDVALPCATQNELDGEAAAALIGAGCRFVAEGANMPCTPDARAAFRKAGVRFAPGKAANAGGVAVSGFEISQNRMRRSLSRDDVIEALDALMQRIHDACLTAAPASDGAPDYAAGATIAGFRRVARAMLAQGHA